MYVTERACCLSWIFLSMVRLALSLALFAIAAIPVRGGRIGDPNDERIVGGEVVEPHSIPFQVLVKFGNYVGCGGSVYDNETIITAAHCCQGQTIQSIKVSSATYRIECVFISWSLRRNGQDFHSYAPHSVLSNPIQSNHKLSPSVLQLSEMCIGSFGEG